VWPATGRAADHYGDTAYSFFASVKWSWDDLDKLLARMVVARLLPAGAIWIVVDDTLCHKRGAQVAFGGFVLDAVTSTERAKNFRFGVNWVVVGRSVHLPFRPDRAFTLPVLWRAYRKKGTDGHHTRPAMAAELARLVATWLPERDCRRIGDDAYLNQTVLGDRPKNLRVLGPLRWNAALHRAPEPSPEEKSGRPRVKGDRRPTPAAMIEDATAFPARTIRVRFGEQERELRGQVLGDVRWPTGAKGEPVTVVRVRDEAGPWRDEVLLATGGGVSAAFVIEGYRQRWGIEVAFAESKQLLGVHDPQVRTGPSVERAHPRAWFVQTLTARCGGTSRTRYRGAPAGVVRADADGGVVRGGGDGVSGGEAGPPVVSVEGGGQLCRHARRVTLAAVGVARFTGVGRRTIPPNNCSTPSNTGSPPSGKSETRVREQVEDAVGEGGHLAGGGRHARVVGVPQQVHGHVPPRRQHPRRVPPPHPAAVLPERLVAGVVPPVLDPQWSRVRASSRSPSSVARPPLVNPYTTSTVVVPFSIRSRTSRNACATRGHPLR